MGQTKRIHPVRQEEVMSSSDGGLWNKTRSSASSFSDCRQVVNALFRRRVSFSSLLTNVNHDRIYSENRNRVTHDMFPQGTSIRNLKGGPMSQPTEAEWQQWKEQGYLVFENAIQGDQLARLQAAFDRCAAEGMDAYLQRIERGEAIATFYDIANPLEKDDVFIDIVDHPSYYGHLKAFTDNKVIFLGPQPRSVPPWVLSYTGWHPDVPKTNPLHIKVQIYVNDVAHGAGEFAYVPGSHRPESGPYSRVKNSDAMPGHKRFAGKAGTAIMFNAAGWHVAMDNKTRAFRKSIILIYEQHTADRMKPEAHASIASRLHTEERRRLFSLEAT